MTVCALVYSDDSAMRGYVIDSIAGTPHPVLGDFVVDEVASYPALLALIDAGGVDLVIVDGDDTPAGGMGIARRLKDEFDDCPPILLVVARAADAWLSLWSKADATVGPRRDPLALADTAGKLLLRAAGAGTLRRRA